MKKTACKAGKNLSVNQNLNDIEKLWFEVGFRSALSQNDEVIPLLQEILLIDPFNAAAHLHLGINLRENGDLPTALAFLGCAAELNEKSPEAAFQYGTALAMNGENRKAHRWLQMASRKVPESEPYQFNLAMNYLQLGNEDKAIECFSKVVAINPENVAALLNTAIYHRRQGNIESATPILKQIISFKPDCAQAHQLLVRNLLTENHCQLAEEALNSALELNPYDFELQLDRIALDSLLARHEKAAHALENLKLLVPECSEMLVDRIRSLKSENGSRSQH
jgi:tetratricopeptide (TPR) repeat protein